ncbi:MAG: NTP transferase domain-containing protein [Chloroflexota bacterium]|nr:NTP transferase domain-containing protein [Chloroflexota bacterium]MDE2919739.1 NTP transferase domain-containing protein [Chloroflexota bacterium]
MHAGDANAHSAGAAGIVMAAGKGTRFASDVPKVMHQVAGRPMLAHVVEAGAAACLEPLVVVIRPGMDVGSAADGTVTVHQPPDGRGTAFAVETGLSAVPCDVGTVVALYGDSPLVRPATVRGVIDALQRTNAVAAITWADVPEPGAFGRVRLAETGLVEGIVETSDATPDDLALTTVNAGPTAFRASWLRRALPRVQPSPTSGERYLTQLVDLAIESGELVAGHQITDLDETIGCDDLERLAAAAAAFRRRA